MGGFPRLCGRQVPAAANDGCETLCVALRESLSRTLFKELRMHELWSNITFAQERLTGVQ